MVKMSPRDSHLFKLFSAAVETALGYVGLAKTGKTYIGKHSDWPELQYHENGLPHITTRGEGPKNYSDAIRGFYSAMYGLMPDQKEPFPDFDKEPALLTLVDYAKAQPRLRQFLLLDRDSDFSATRMVGFIGDALDRYIHTTKKLELNEDQLLPIYLPLERYLLEETLPVVTVVPILFLKFDMPRFEINHFMWVEALSDELQLARSYHGLWGDARNHLVESAATHALFIGDRSLGNWNWLATGQDIMSLESYPVEEVDRFFAALRISRGYATGYAQLLTLPLGWASGYTAELMSLDGPTVKNYPPSFEHGAWREEVATVTSVDADAIREICEGLQEIARTKESRRVRLAMHRLNLSALRTTEEDGIIDAMIAVEALLASDSREEMSHKVAMRLAALYKIAGQSDTEQIFREMKRIYGFRSKVVHGDPKADNYREVERAGVKLPVVDAAVEHLRTAFATLIRKPALLDPVKIDNFLLTDQL